MGKQVDQGTRWETRIRAGAALVGRTARRLAKTGKADEPDVEIEGQEYRLAVAWERWRKVTSRRTATRMVVIPESHFYELLALDKEHRFGYYLQCKSTQAGSLSAWMEGLRKWKERNG